MVFRGCLRSQNRRRLSDSQGGASLAYKHGACHLVGLQWINSCIHSAISPHHPTLKLETQLCQQIMLCGHNCLFTADPLSDRRHACRREKPHPVNHSACACFGSSSSHEIPFPSRRRAGISQGGWYTNSVGRLKIYATVLETKAGGDGSQLATKMLTSIITNMCLMHQGSP